MKIAISGKGGVGKTTLSSVYAIKLAEMGHRVALVDLSLFGNIDMLFRVSSIDRGLNRISVVFEENKGGKNEELHSVIAEKGVIKLEKYSNLDIIPAATAIKMDRMTTGCVKALIEGLQGLNYEYIVFDTTSDLSERTVGALENADKIYLVANQDISTLWRTSGLKDIFNSLYIEESTLGVVLNRFRKDVRYNPHEIKEVLGTELLCTVPDYKGNIVDAFNAESIEGLNKGKLVFRKFHKALENIIEGDGSEDRRDNKEQKAGKKFRLK